MELTKEHLEECYSRMSIDEMAIHFAMAKSTLYYHMRKLGVVRRTKSEAQQRHLSSGTHQRLGKNHTPDAKEKISNGTRRFWDSASGQDQKSKLGDIRRKEWKKRTPRQRSKVLSRLQAADRPSAGELSRFGKKLAEFLARTENVKTGMKLTPDHISDIILVDRKVVVELLLPVAIYGEAQEHKIASRYDRLANELNDAGYRIMIIEDKSNSISAARCVRVYEQLLKFFEDSHLQRTTIVS